MDLLAPWGGAAPNNSTVVTTSNILDTYEDTFTGTSASAPHVAGVYGLLWSEAIENGWELEPEDYEGIVKSMSDDIKPPPIDYFNDYDDYPGWGHLNAGKIFIKLNEGYEVTHYSTMDLTAGEWQNDELTDWAFFADGIIAKPLEDGNYKVKIREWTGTINLPNRWIINDEDKLYVWGRCGGNTPGGYSMAKPNYQTHFTEVTSGQGGNGITEGIIHNHSLSVTAKTYQYEVYNSEGSILLGRFPNDDLLGINISVFGKVNPTSMKEGEKIEDEIVIYPNPAESYIMLTLNDIYSNIDNITILDLLGNKMAEWKNNHLSRIIKLEISAIPTGMYLCRIKSGNIIYTKQLYVIK